MSVVILADPLPLFRPHHADEPRQNDAAWVDFAGPRQDAEGRCSTQGSEKNQSQRRRRAELTPSNQDVAKALDTQSRRRKRAERSPEDAQRRKVMDTLWRRRLNSARAAGRGRVLESMS